MRNRRKDVDNTYNHRWRLKHPRRRFEWEVDGCVHCKLTEFQKKKNSEAPETDRAISRTVQLE
jgi:hypothetical protein